MNDIYMARVVSGLYDVPLEGHKPRFGLPRRNQNRAPRRTALRFNKFPEGSTLDFKSHGWQRRSMPPPHALRRPRVRSRAHLRATMRTAVACSTCAWACAHLYLVATSAATW